MKFASPPPQIRSILFSVIAFKCPEPSQAGMVCVCSPGRPHRPCGVRILQREQGSGAAVPRPTHLSLRLLLTRLHPASRTALGSARYWKWRLSLPAGRTDDTPGPSPADAARGHSPSPPNFKPANAGRAVWRLFLNSGRRNRIARPGAGEAGAAARAAQGLASAKAPAASAGLLPGGRRAGL